MPHQELQSQWLGQHVCWLLLGVNLLKGEGSIIPRRVLQEVEVLEVDVLGSGTHLGDFSDSKSPIVVLKSLAMNHWALREDVETQFLHLVESVLEGDGCSEGS